MFQLVHLFGSVRDQWIAEDLNGWLAPNRIYPGVADSLAAAVQSDEVFIVTTKQAGASSVKLALPKLYNSVMIPRHCSGQLLQHYLQVELA